MFCPLQTELIKKLKVNSLIVLFNPQIHFVVEMGRIQEASFEALTSVMSKAITRTESTNNKYSLCIYKVITTPCESVRFKK